MRKPKRRFDGKTPIEMLATEVGALLQVPSAVVPATWNILINPQHPESAQIRVVRVHEQPIDRRLPRNR